MWRQHRFEAAWAAILCVIAAAVLFYSIEEVTGLRQTLAGLGQTAALVALNDRLGGTLMVLTPMLLVLPILTGVFVGAPLFARDFEQGTHRLLWTQSIARRRWFWATLTLVLGPATVLAAVIAVLATIWVNVQGPLTDRWQHFDEQGLAFASYVVFAFALGATLGVVLRRTVPSMAAAGGIYVAMRAFVAILIRPQMQAPLRAGSDAPIPDGSWVFPTVFTDSSGRLVPAERIAEAMGKAGHIPGSVSNYLHGLGIEQWVYYQPADRFWMFQAEEAILFIALAALLLALAALVLERWSN
jgi:ABC-type transport system involved in multi-copper enzyme maturation permease subunit